MASNTLDSPPGLTRRMPGAALHPMLRKAIGVARVLCPKDERFDDAGPDLAVLERLACGLRRMGGEG